ncbi:amino acid adenylation domain-containing protein [Oxalobacteraceae bacterium GrIS 1.11]
MSQELRQRLAGLAPGQIQALMKKLEQNGRAPAAAGKAERNPAHRYPLSSGQERMWFLCQLAPDSRAANNPGVLRASCAHALNAASLERSFAEIGRRHEILRTTFHEEGGTPYQLVHESMPLRFSWRDLRALEEAPRAAEALRIAHQEGVQAFDLERGPLFALTVLQLGELDYMLLITSHHIISDGWSNALFSKELSTFYILFEGENGAAQAPRPPEPRFQYIDHVQWERDWLRSDACQDQIAYWKRKLLPEAPPLALPTDHPRPPAISHAGALQSVTAPAALAAKLKNFARQERLTQFPILMAAWVALLHRYTGQQEVVVGTSTANRNKREAQEVMGLFINTLAIRVEVDGGQSARALLDQVSAVCQEAMRHQDVPFEKLIKEINPPRNLHLHPIFQVMFVYQNVPAMYEVPGMQLELLKIDYQASKFDLSLWAEEINEDLVLTLYYSSDLFEAETAQRILLHYQALLDSMLSEPTCAVDKLPYFVFQPPLPGAMRPAAAEGFHRRFESQARLHPDQVAVESAAKHLTYGALNGAANRLARHLLALDLAPASPVALLLMRAPNMLVGVLGIMKAGAAYLPLDPIHPADRIALLLRDAEAGMIVTEERFRPLLEQLPFPIRAIYLDTDALAIARHGAANLELAIDGEQPAYLIYTSGTTGMPKGVEVLHRNLLNYCDAIWPVMGLSPEDRCASVSSLAADLGNTMLFPPLAHGATVVIIDEELASDAAGLARYFSHRPVDAMKIVPSHLRALLACADARHLIPRKKLILGGEACSFDLIARVKALVPDCVVINHYGPTETTVGVLTYTVPRAGLPEHGAVPLGFPLAGSRIYLLDKAGQCVPVGVAGEIYIGGANVARGYLKRPALTAERFVASPFADGERLYRSGDLARWRTDGALEFLGRADRQLKLRGFRIELSEIEAALSAHPDIVQAVVLAPAPSDVKQQLPAFIRLRAGAALDGACVTAYLRTCLPAQMIPGVIVFVDAIALTSNGKIDYAQLAGVPLAVGREGQRPPRDAIELSLLQIWQEVLGSDAIGIDDNFFQLGGHSLLAVQLMARVFDAYAQRLPLASLFEHGSIEEMAELLRAKAAPPAATPLVGIQAKGRHTPACFVHPAGGNVLCYAPLAQALGRDFPFYGLQATGGRNGDTNDDTSIAAIAAAYAQAVFAALPQRVPLLGGWSMGALVAFEMAHCYARERGQFPVVAILDQLAPDRARDSGDDDLARLLAFAKKASLFAGADFKISEEMLLGRTPEQQAALFLECFRRHRLVPETTRLHDFQGFLTLMLAHNRMTMEYCPAVYPGKLLVFRAEEALQLGVEAPADLGWQQFSSEKVTVIAVPGNHVSMVLAPNVRIIADRLGAYLHSQEQGR